MVWYFFLRGSLDGLKDGYDGLAGVVTFRLESL